MSKKLLHLESATVRFKEKVLFEGLELNLQANEFFCLLGSSGGGKSSLLKVLAGLLPLSAGKLQWFDPVNQLPGPRPAVGFVFQDPQLLPWRSVLENTQLPLELSEFSFGKADVAALSREALRQVGLEHAETLYPHQLSGGMRMRVSIARALVSRPKVLFMDEPFAALDEVARFRLQEELLTLASTYKMTIIFVTHSIYEASFLADRVAILGQGKLLFDERVQYAEPRNLQLRNSPMYQTSVNNLSEKLAKASATQSLLEMRGSV